MGLTNEQLNTPLAPPPPEDLYFSEKCKAWIVSRYAEVLAALRSSDLDQVGSATAGTDSSAEARRENTCLEIRATASSSHNSTWQLEISGNASARLRSLPGNRPVDLAEEFIRPWCLTSAMAMMSIDPVHSEFLRDLVSCFLNADASPDDVHLKHRAKEASRELDSFFQLGSPSSKSMFLGMAQTIPAFLASAWAGLLQHSHEMRELKEHPDRINIAAEELLRYAGPVHTLFRQAHQCTEICGRRIRRGDRLILRVGSANRDPQQFSDPNRLRFVRDVAGHLALGSGPHYCAGSSLVRAMTAAATQTLLARCSDVLPSGPVQWSCGNMLVWASSLPVVFAEAT